MPLTHCEQRTTKGASKNKKTNSKARAVKSKREGAKARDLVTRDGLNGNDSDFRDALLAPSRKVSENPSLPRIEIDFFCNEQENPLVPTMEKKAELEKGGEDLASVLKELEMSL